MTAFPNMLKYLHKNQQAFILLIVFYCLLLVIGNGLLNSEFVYSQYSIQSPFLLLYQNALLASSIGRVMFTTLVIIVLLFLGFYLVRISINYLLIPVRNQYPAVFFITIASFAFKTNMISPAILGSVFLVIAFERMFMSIEEPQPSFRFFDAGLLLAIGSFFYINLLFFLPFLWVSQVVLKQFNLREFLYTLVGLLVPFIYLISGYFIFDQNLPQFFSGVFQWTLSLKKTEFNWFILGGLAAYAIFVAVAAVFSINEYLSTKIQTRKLYQILFYLFVNGVLIYLFVPSAGLEMLYIVAIPVSILFSIYYSECNNTFLDQLIFSILIMVPPVVIYFA